MYHVLYCWNGCVYRNLLWIPQPKNLLLLIDIKTLSVRSVKGRKRSGKKSCYVQWRLPASHHLQLRQGNFDCRTHSFRQIVQILRLLGNLHPRYWPPHPPLGNPNQLHRQKIQRILERQLGRKVVQQQCQREQKYGPNSRSPEYSSLVLEMHGILIDQLKWDLYIH